jgi:hypothetical protein
MRLVRAHFLVALVASSVLTLSASASAFSVTGVTVTPQTPSGPLPASGPAAAGAHPDLATTLDFSDSGNATADSAKDLVIHFAPGIVAYVNHVGRCSQAAFAVDDSSSAPSCPADSAVGSVAAHVTLDVLGVPTPMTLTGTIYNVEPPAGSPAAFGIDIPPPIGPRIKRIAPISVDPHDLGLTATLANLPNTAQVLSLGVPITVGLHTDSITQTLFGYVGGASFFTNPTSCIPAAISVDATSYGGASGAASGSYTPTDCAHVPFSTSLSISVDPPISDWTSTVTSDVKPGSSDIPRVNSHVKSTTVVLPESLLLNPALAARLDACTDAQFALTDTSVEAKCPASSAVGDINFVSPILGSFPGKAYFGTSAPGDRLRLFLDVPLFGAHIKVSAHVHPSTTTGQITTVFDLLPQIAFTDFTLTFHGGPRSALVTPTVCGTHTATALTTPWSGTAPSSSSGDFSVSFDGKGAACQRIFQPTMSTAVSNPTSGASPTFTLVANRPDRNVPIGRMTYQLPAGLVGNLALKGLAQCSLADAAAARCPASSRIGHVVSVDGSGTEPPSLPGTVYLTKPKVAGDPAGLSVQVPAKLGPVDAGIVIVGVRLQLRSDGGLTATSDPIPPLQEGIPLAIRQLTVTIDRKGFMRNPSSCGKKQPTGHFDAIGGGSADASSTLTFKDCGKLRFAPKLSARLGAKGSDRAGGHPPFTTTITTGGADATIRRAHVALPSGLATNTTALNAACAQAAFDAGTCSKQSQVATARALSPLIPGTVSGPVYLVKQPKGLPKLVVQLRTPIAITFTGFVNIGKDGRIGTTFNPVPDLPITRFSLAFHGGRYGALAANRNLCRGTLRLPTQFTGANGKSLKTRPKIKLVGCPKRHGHRATRR